MYLPILAVVALAFLGVIGYFLKVGLGVTGAALGPTAQGASTPAAMATQAPGEIVVPQTGGAGVGGGTPVPANGGGPPAPVARVIAELRDRLQRNPRDLEALVGLADLYFEANKYAQSLPYYRRALALDPRNPDVRTDYAVALYGDNQDLEALAQLQSVLSMRPAFPEALFNEGIIANAIGRRTQAVEAFRKFLSVAPHNAHAAQARTALENLGA